MKSARSVFVTIMAGMTIAMLTVVSIPAAAPVQTRVNRYIPFNFYLSGPRFLPGSHHVSVFSRYTKVSDGKGHVAHIMAESSISSLAFRVTGTGPHLISRNDNDYFFSEIRGPEYNFAHGLIPSHPVGTFGKGSGNIELPGYVTTH